MIRIVAVAVVALGLLAAPARAGERLVPQGWLGVTVDGPVSPYEPGEWDRMVRSGVESVRAEIRWYQVQPYPPGGVPATERSRFRDMDGVPTDLSRFDAIVAAAAARGMSVLPVVQLSPGWAAREERAAPFDRGAYGRFLTTLVHRYGPAGSLWEERPDLPRIPIRTWQLWNEPNTILYWLDQPFASSFVPLLRAGARSLRAADPGATIVLAGLTNYSWVALKRIYDAGGKGSFDAVAVHPYTRRPRDVLRLVRRARREMRRRGDGRLPVWVTELSWPAAKGEVDTPLGFEVGRRQQAVRLRAALRLLADARKRLNIERVYWYTWLSAEQGPSVFDWSGLRRLRHGRTVSAPALAAFRQAARRLEGCAKARDARSCA